MLYEIGIGLVVIGVTLMMLGLACCGDGCPKQQEKIDER